MWAGVLCVLRLPPCSRRALPRIRLRSRFGGAMWIADGADGGNGLGDLVICRETPAARFFGWHLRQESLAWVVIDEDRGEEAAMLGQQDDAGPFLRAQPDAEHEAHGPVAGDDAAILVDHEYRSVGVRLLGKRRRDFVVTVEDRADGGLLRRAFGHPRPASTEDQRHPFVGMHEGGGGDESGDQAVDRAHADRAVMTARAAQDRVKLIIGECGCGRRARHAALRPMSFWARAHAHGISSYRRAAGQRLTSWVSTSVR